MSNFFHFEFTKLVTQMKGPLKRKQNKLLHDALAVKASELEAVKESFQVVKDYTGHAQMSQAKFGCPVFLHGWLLVNLNSPTLNAPLCQISCYFPI